MLIAFDWECSGLDYYRKDFQVLSLALAYRSDGKVKTKYLTDRGEIEDHLWALSSEQTVVYNLSYELGVWITQFPHIPVPTMLDCMRLVQINGLPPELPKVMRHGAFGLKRSVMRLLPGTQDWSEPIKTWLRANGVGKGKEMQNLHLAPPGMLQEYNVADARYTLKIAEMLMRQFDESGFDWRVDHELYCQMTERIVKATINGIAVDRVGLATYREEVIAEVARIEEEFLATFAKGIDQVRQILLAKANAKRKKKFLTEPPKFNPGSGDHLELLCCEALQMEVVKRTKPTKRFPEGKPSFRAADLGQWGDVGKLLAKRRKRLLVKAQADSILEATEYDGRIHPSLKSATVTGRLASGKEG